MPVTLVVLVAAVVGRRGRGRCRGRPAPDPVDPEAEERWLVALARPAIPASARRARSIDRQVVGGLMLVVALAIVFVTAFVVGAVFDMVDRNCGLAAWDQAVAEWGSRNATSWSTDVLDALTDLGGTASSSWSSSRWRRTTTSATATPTSSCSWWSSWSAWR